MSEVRSTLSRSIRILYVPRGGHPLTATIPRGAAIVGPPAGSSGEVEVHFVDAIEPLAGMLTLADRALCASGRMLRRADQGFLIVPRETLVVVGTIDGNTGRITLTGPLSERAVADWLGTARLDRGELRETGRALTDREVIRVETVGPACLDPTSLQVLLRRGGIRPAGEEWIAADGRRTDIVEEALIWALEEIARQG